MRWNGDPELSSPRYSPGPPIVAKKGQQQEGLFAILEAIEVWPEIKQKNVLLATALFYSIGLVLLHGLDAVSRQFQFNKNYGYVLIALLCLPFVLYSAALSIISGVQERKIKWTYLTLSGVTSLVVFNVIYVMVIDPEEYVFGTSFMDIAYTLGGLLFMVLGAFISTFYEGDPGDADNIIEMIFLVIYYSPILIPLAIGVSLLQIPFQKFSWYSLGHLLVSMIVYLVIVHIIQKNYEQALEASFRALYS